MIDVCFIKRKIVPCTAFLYGQLFCKYYT